MQESEKQMLLDVLKRLDFASLLDMAALEEKTDFFDAMPVKKNHNRDREGISPAEVQCQRTGKDL